MPGPRRGVKKKKTGHSSSREGPTPPPMAPGPAPIRAHTPPVGTAGRHVIRPQPPPAALAAARAAREVWLERPRGILSAVAIGTIISGAVTLLTPTAAGVNQSSLTISPGTWIISASITLSNTANSYYQCSINTSSTFLKSVWYYHIRSESHINSSLCICNYYWICSSSHEYNVLRLDNEWDVRCFHDCERGQFF